MPAGTKGRAIGAVLLSACACAFAGAWIADQLVSGPTDLAPVPVAKAAAAVAPPTSEPSFTIDCPAPFRSVGAIGPGLWGCRAPGPAKDGFVPNCNLTASPAKGALDSKHYFERAMSVSSTLATATRLGAGEVALRAGKGYQALFEHDLTGRRLRMLATVVVRNDRVFAVTCAAPPAEFEGFAERFQRISQSLALSP